MLLAMVRLVLLLAAAQCACTGNVATIGPGGDGAPDFVRPSTDGTGRPKDGPAPGDTGPKGDVLPHPGDPCPFAECTADALCLGGLCMRKCSQMCNEPTDECVAGEACYAATTFSSACFPDATVDTGGACGAEARCKPGNLCVRVNSGGPRCYLLCKLGCNGTCAQADNGCEFCIP